MPKKVAIGASVSLDLRLELENAKKRHKELGYREILNSTNKAKKRKEEFKKNKGISERINKDLKDVETESKNRSEAEKSRAALLRKAKIYERLQSSEILINDHDHEVSKILNESSIDFERKAVQNVLDGDRTVYSKLSNKESRGNGKTPENEDDPWVEFIDEFGRTRVVKKSQIPRYIQDQNTNDKGIPELFSGDMAVEEERRRWEERAMNEVNAVNSHYSLDDSRTRGIGYYKLSLDEDTRQQQLSELEELRRETELKRMHRLPLSEKRKMLLKQQKIRVADAFKKMETLKNSSPSL